MVTSRVTNGAAFGLLLAVSGTLSSCGARLAPADGTGDAGSIPRENTSVAPGTTFTSSAAPPARPKPNETVFVPAVPGEPAPPRPSASLDCSLAGTFAGKSACCAGDLCVGECSSSRSCTCGGHPWCEFPAVCCGMACVGPDDPLCRIPEDRAKEPLTIEVIEGNTCGASVNRSDGGVLQACCGGILCQGRCVKNGINDAPHCECFGIRGGAPKGMECCASLGYVKKGWCDW